MTTNDRSRCWVCREPAADGRNLCAACTARQPSGPSGPVEATLVPAARIAADPRIAGRAATPKPEPTAAGIDRASYARHTAAVVAEPPADRPMVRGSALRLVGNDGTVTERPDPGWVPAECLAPFKTR